MANKDAINYEQFVVVAESEWKFDYYDGNYERYDQRRSTADPYVYYCHCPAVPNCGTCGLPVQVFTPDPRITKHSMKMGTIEWNIMFNDQEKTLEFTCKSVADQGKMDEEQVHLELVGYDRREPDDDCYEQIFKTRHIFTAFANSLFCRLKKRDNVFTFRVLKSRLMFPDFTLESNVVGANVKLCIDGKVFHVNQQLLSTHSKHFDRMFNGGNGDNTGNQQEEEEIELKHEPADPTVFHDFLLVMFVTEALPNPNNVVALLGLAKHYQADNVRDKCQRHLSMCRELPVEQRYMLAGENGLKELRISLKDNASWEEEKRMLVAVSRKVFPLMR